MTPNALIVSVGDELALGATQDTNGVFAAQMLTAVGLRVIGTRVVRDEVEEIVRVLKKAFIDAELVVISGGLGPTADDVTREALAIATGDELEERAELVEAIEARFVARGREMPAANRQQARIPSRGEAIPNPLGTAPGILVHRGTRLVVSLPGVPFEFCNMLEAAVVPATEAKFDGLLRPQSVRSLLVTGVPESALDERLRELMLASVNPRIGLSAKHGAVTVRLVAADEEGRRADEVLDEMEATLREILGADCCAGYPAGPQEAVAEVEGLGQVAVADGVTAGLLAARLAGAGVEVAAWGGSPAVLTTRFPVLTDHAGAIEAAVAATAVAGAATGVGLWPGEGGFLFVAACHGDAVMERVVVPAGDPYSDQRRCVAAGLDLLRRVASGLPPPPDTGELEALAAIAETISTPEGEAAAEDAP